MLLYALIVSLGINLSMFLIAYKLQSDKLTDISYAVTFATLAAYGLWLSDGSDYHVLLFFMVLLWAIRLGSFLLYRVTKVGKDSRFDNMRASFFAFGRFWLLQAITVWVLMNSALLSFSQNSLITPLVITGVVIWCIGLVIESIADFQKFAFTQNAKNKGKWIDSGIWQYSRHPNYFGEILVWVGVYIVSIQALSTSSALIALVSPLFITVLLLGVSGIPLLEKAADKRWGDNKAYVDYKNRTSVLLPLPKKSR